jgi:putative hemolysin
MRLALPAVLILLTGCAPTPVPAPPVIGMANPASVSCIDNGGRSEIRDTPGGQIGVCVFHDGRRCEEWALFRDHRCVAP